MKKLLATLSIFFMITVTFAYSESAPEGGAYVVARAMAEGRLLLEEAKKCQFDDECVVTTELFCPFSCYEAVNRNTDLSELLRMISKMQKDMVCETCVIEDVTAVCRKDQCVKQIQKDKDDKSVACTLEAKLCPDGSSVGRVGPNCAFKACPK